MSVHLYSPQERQSSMSKRQIRSPLDEAEEVVEGMNRSTTERGARDVIHRPVTPLLYLADTCHTLGLGECYGNESTVVIPNGENRPPTTEKPRAFFVAP